MAAVLLAVILMTAGAAPGMQQPEQTPEKNAFKFSVQSQLVEIYLTVARGKQLIPHLKVVDFEILEDGVRVPIDQLDDQEVPLQIVLLFDVSESIGDSLKTIQDAAAAFVESLKTQDRVTLVPFSSEIRAYAQITDDREPILRIIRNTKAGGMTRLYEALLLGMKYLDGKPGRKAIVCFTDGQDTSGTSSRSVVLNAAARFGFPIYTIGAGAGLELSSLKIILREFAEVNGGKAFFIQNLPKLREAFLEVAAELRSAYVLGYYTRVPSDGRWHDISIRTLDPTNSVRARKGFFAKDH